MHKCTRCELFKDPSFFTKSSKSASGLQSTCKSCMKEYQREWRARNPGKPAEYCARYEARNPERRKALREISGVAYAPRRLELGRILEAKSREKRNAQARARIAQNPEKHNAKGKTWRQANPEKARAIISRWQQQNPGAAKANGARWRKAVVQATPVWANPAKIAEFYDTADALGMWTGEWYHVDHIVPLAGKTVRGLHCEANLQILTAADNMAKGNRHWPNQP